MKKLIVACIGFILLDLYFNLVTNILRLDGALWVVGALLFFVFAHFVAKATSLDGLKGLGYRFYVGWWKHLLTGFLIGFTFWGLMYLILFAFGVYTFHGFVDFKSAIWILIQGLIGYGLGSTINDAITRGYAFAHLGGKAPFWVILGASSIIYAFEDAWNEGFSIHNTTFSLILGMSLGYAFLKTKAIWFNTGIHYGLNMMYCTLFGVGSSGGIIVKEKTGVDSISGILSIVVPILMFLFVIVYFIRVKKKEQQIVVG